MEIYLDSVDQQNHKGTDIGCRVQGGCIINNHGWSHIKTFHLFTHDMTQPPRKADKREKIFPPNGQL